MDQLDVKASKFQLILTIALGIFFVPAGLGMVATNIMGGIKPVPVIIGLLLLVSFAAVAMLYLRGRGFSVASFNDQGLTRNDGRTFEWANLGRVVDKMTVQPGSAVKKLWRTEIQFNDGSAAWLIPGKVANHKEVNAFVSNLSCERVSEDA